MAASDQILRGGIKIFPCVTGSIDKQAEYETEANKIIQAVYDNAQGYSLRDRDDGPEDIDNVGSIVRMRLSCRAAENLMLSDDVLAAGGTDWDAMQQRVREFVAEFPQHPYHAEVQYFLNHGLDRKGADIKDIRNVLVSFMTKKAWEVLVGQTIARLAQGEGREGEHSLASYLGQKVMQNISGLAP